jgi:hypothetical protein
MKAVVIRSCWVMQIRSGLLRRPMGSRLDRADMPIIDPRSDDARRQAQSLCGELFFSKSVKARDSTITRAKKDDEGPELFWLQ